MRVGANRSQMPGVDGIFATRMIRFLERELEHLNTRDPNNAKPRAAIIAVSSHLYEEKRFDYVQSGYVYPSCLPKLLSRV